MQNWAGVANRAKTSTSHTHTHQQAPKIIAIIAKLVLVSMNLLCETNLLDKQETRNLFDDLVRKFLTT